jgi:hypothetical protein
MSTKSLIAATLRRHEPELIDQITNDFILFKLFGDKDLAPKLFQMRDVPDDAMYADGIKLVDGPGRSIVEKIRKLRNSTVKAYERYDLLDLAPQDNFDEVEMPWKSIAGVVNMANEDLDKNRGSKTKIFDLLEASEDDLAVSMQEKTADWLLGSTPVADPKRPAGLMDWVQDDPTTLPPMGSAVTGGIDGSQAANAFWRNQVVDQAAAAFGTDQTGTGCANLRQLIRKMTFGKQRAKIVVAGEAAFEALEKSLVSQVRYNDPRVNWLANVGVESIIFKNTAIVMEKRIDAVRAVTTDANGAVLPNSAFYGLNPRSYRYWGMKFRWFKLGNFREPTNQDTQVAHMIARLNSTCRARREQGVLKNVV